MHSFLNGSVDVKSYRQELFRVFPTRMEPHGDETDRILQTAYGDADDYESEIRLPYTITEEELRSRVATLSKELVERGYELSR